MVANAIKTESIRERTRMDFFNRGVVYSEHDIMNMRARFEAEASPCPRCHMMVHPDMIDRHNKVHHPEIIRIPTTPVIADHLDTPVQMAKLKGTSRTLPISATWQAQGSSATFYRLDVNAGAVKYQWVEASRLEFVTNSPDPVKRLEPVKVAEKRVSHLWGHTTLFPYGTFQIVA
jgi:hypothetical protein